MKHIDAWKMFKSKGTMKIITVHLVTISVLGLNSRNCVLGIGLCSLLEQ